MLARIWPAPAIEVADAFYRTGSLVFGGGHVVLPLLEAELVTPGLIDHNLFLAGYGAAQAVPGPLFAFAAYVGALLNALPGMASIRAAVQPARTNAMYFVSRGDGSSHFSATLNEHNAAVRRFILRR